ncbi:O-antigen ligase family protein [Pedobacter sp. SYP-B3415]|uniref:O-antigen ligase family protein n=1 Tax=Pedobacter sp. SYP-B3415 TaxID=2496641 RepID=UPI00101CCB9E|nr:O-antigen ligase family protein [Pedobacter sp. SYP-B3415]
MKLLTVFFVCLYLYALSLGVFMTELFRLPAPLLFYLPLVFLFKAHHERVGGYSREVMLLGISSFLFYAVGLSDLTAFIANSLCMVLCAAYFYYFVASEPGRLNQGMIIFFSLLAFSGLILVLNHFLGASIDRLREQILGEQVMQSPSGLSKSQFAFGYQLAAFCTMIFVAAVVFKQNLLVKLLAFAVCLGLLFLGMQRSAFVAFACCTTLFLVAYYRFRAVFALALMLLICYGIYHFYLQYQLDGVENIITKNEHNDATYNRSSLSGENLRIYLDYPYGLIFYGKNWADVIYRNQVFSSGVTSHNAYLMFLTYLGPFLGLGLLGLIYRQPVKIFFYVLRNIRQPGNALLICLSFAFLATSVNALSHNPWLISSDGPTLFLYFALLHTWALRQEQVAAASHSSAFVYA